MSHAVHTLLGPDDPERERVSKVILDVAKVPRGTRIWFAEAKRTLPQNDRMWAMLTDISRQKKHCGRRYAPDRWKVIFLHALGQEVEFIPSLDGATFIPLGVSSSALGKSQMSALIDLMAAWGAENGVVFKDPREAPGTPSRGPRHLEPPTIEGELVDERPEF